MGLDSKKIDGAGNSRKQIEVDINVVDENTSVVQWTHQPRMQRFSAGIDVLLSPCDDIDFNSPELGKLCEKFLKL